VYRFEQLWHEGDRRAFVIECSSGTYVRSLIGGLGDAYCVELRRTRIGAFDVSAANPDRQVPLSDALAFLPEVRMDGTQARRVAHGARVPAPVGLGGDEIVRIVDEAGLIALARPEAEDGMLRVLVGLRRQD
ncbi:MAG: tRNA pseudouridine(55) synthase TruB, partial [Solirubrobacteraceae bacterium]